MMGVGMKKLIITSSVFENGGSIPEKYTCDGDNINPPLSIKGIPPESQSLVLTIDDPDAVGEVIVKKCSDNSLFKQSDCSTRTEKTWLHWLVWDIDTSGSIKEESIPGVEGINSFNRAEYDGPCPPVGTHRYVFRVFALNTKLNLPKGSTLTAVETAMHNHIVAEGELLGKYGRTLA